MVEFLSELGGSSEDAVDVLETVCIHMENRGGYNLGQVGGIHSRPRLVWAGCKSDLVIDNDMDSASDCIIPEIRHLHGLKHDTLSGKGSVTMDQNRHNFLSAHEIISEVLLSPGLTHHDWVNALEMGRIRQDFDGHFFVPIIFSGESGSQMIFYIS